MRFRRMQRGFPLLLMAFLAVNLRDNLLHRWISNGHIHDVAVLHDGGYDRLQWAARGIYLQFQAISFRLYYLHPFCNQHLFMNGSRQLDTEALLTALRISLQHTSRRFLQQEINRLNLQVVALHFRDRCIQDDFAMINNNGATANLLDVTCIMRGEKDGHSLFRIQLTDQVAYALLSNNIQANGWLI